MSVATHPSRKRQQTSSSPPASDDEASKLHKKQRTSEVISTAEGPENQDANPCLQDATTGRRIYSQDAANVIYHFASKHNIPQPTCTTERTSGTGYVCAMVFSQDSPFKKPVTGPVCYTEELAKQNTCFLICRKLYKQGLLDHTLYPHVSPGATITSVPANVSSSTAKAVQLYKKKTAFFWANPLGPTLVRLYPTIVHIETDSNVRHASFLFLTKRPLPSMPSFAAFESGRRVVIGLDTGAPFKLNQEHLAHIQKYSMRVFRSIANKPFSVTPDALSYLVAPLHKFAGSASSNTQKWKFPDVSSYIPWEAVKLAADQWKTSLVSDDGSLDTDEEETVVQDRAVEFTNRFYLRKVRYDMTPNSKVDDGGGEETFLERCKTRVRDLEGLKNNDQPMLEIDLVPALNNNLNMHCTVQPSKFVPKYLIPELCYKFVLSASMFRSMLLLPSIVHRIDQFLVMTELNDVLFDNRFCKEQLLAATSPTSAFGEPNYERLEFLGDASLKMMSSTYCYLKMPEARESAIHEIRRHIITNAALHTGGVQAGLPQYIQSKPFIPKIWQPDIPPPDAYDVFDIIAAETISLPKGRSKRKKQKETQSVQWLAEKTVADVVEALIAVGYLSGGNEAALSVAKSLHVPMPDVRTWEDFRSLTSPIALNSDAPFPQNSLRAFENWTEYHFKQPGILVQALTHPSLHSADTQAYEQLEFLGDAVLDFLVSRYVYNAYPNLGPGGMSMLKSAMVSNSTLATISVLNGLHHYLRYSSEDLSAAFSIFEDEVRVLREREQKVAREEGRPLGQYWLELSPSKALSDVLESVLGAIYVADGYSMEGVDVFFDNVLKPFYNEHVRLHSLSHHPGRTLYDLLHKLGCQQHRMVKTVDKNSIRCDVVIHETVLASAEDKSSSLVVRRAASAALDALQGDQDFVSRICDCKINQTDKKQMSSVQLGYEDAEGHGSKKTNRKAST